MIELWIIRHGQTEDNITKTIAGHTPGKLTQLGILQAEQTGEFLKNEFFDFSYVSDLGRTRATYEHICSKMNNQVPLDKVTFTPIMREKAGGEYEGKPLEVFRNTAAQLQIPLRKFKGAGGETWEEVNIRAQKFFLMLATNHLRVQAAKQVGENEENLLDEVEKNKIKVLGIAHGGFIMEVHNTIEYVQYNKESIMSNSAKNCSIHKIQITLKPETHIEDLEQLTLQDLIITCLDQNNDDHIKDVF